MTIPTFLENPSIPPNITILYLKWERENCVSFIINFHIMPKQQICLSNTINLISLWFVSICISDLGPGTEYVLRTTHRNSDILDTIPAVSTLCIDARTLCHCTRCPCARSSPNIIRYPACGLLAWMSDTRASSSSSVKSLYRSLTENPQSFIRLCSVHLETPTKFAMHFTDRPRLRSSYTYPWILQLWGGHYFLSPGKLLYMFPCHFAQRQGDAPQ